MQRRGGRKVAGSAAVLTPRVFRLTHASCHAGVKRKKKLHIEIFTKTNLYVCFRLTHKCFAFTSSSTFIPHTLNDPTEVTAGIRQYGEHLDFLPNDADTGQHELQLCKASCPL